MSRRETNYRGEVICIADAGDPILSPDMRTVWGHFREVRHTNDYQIRFITAQQFLGLSDRYVESPTETRTCRIFWEKGVWVCSEDTTQEDLAHCDMFVVSALKGPYAVMTALRTLCDDADTLREMADLCSSNMQPTDLRQVLGHLAARKLHKEKRRIAA